MNSNLDALKKSRKELEDLYYIYGGYETIYDRAMSKKYDEMIIFIKTITGEFQNKLDEFEELLKYCRDKDPKRIFLYFSSSVIDELKNDQVKLVKLLELELSKNSIARQIKHVEKKSQNPKEYLMSRGWIAGVDVFKQQIDLLRLRYISNVNYFGPEIPRFKTGDEYKIFASILYIWFKAGYIDDPVKADGNLDYKRILFYFNPEVKTKWTKDSLRREYNKIPDELKNKRCTDHIAITLSKVLKIDVNKIIS